MTKVRIYQTGTFHVNQTLTLTKDTGHHVAVVLRMQVGENLTLFCGDNREFDATIVSIFRKTVVLKLLTVTRVNRESPCAIHLAQVISKGDRMEWVVQKAVELGIASIVPLISERCVVRLEPGRQQKKLEQWRAIAVAACEQSGRNRLPSILPISSLESYLKNNKSAFCYVLQPQSATKWRDLRLNGNDIGLLVGPEGGFSEEELQQIRRADYNFLGLGPRILRTETAAIAAISLLQAICGDL